MARTLPLFDPHLEPSVSDLIDLGKLVRNRRAKAKLRIDDAAALCGVSSDVLSRLENGKPITADKLLLVLGGLGLRMLVVPKEDVPTNLGAALPDGAVDE
ncbi:helix-turn-helix transcriptional regulator [Variovorax sp. YR216]|uniref:helix-turn-helix domain-containing protein n=1 Tax=Variovorax sp. YR216 TaxID=1882828 RepID=UPI00089B88EF|nr:helix-turn-helix transcriptional regulator [Variovorax sp. YR216]SEB17794.1 transcriptional regulator, XRE family [Variovorax sp. YR216]